MKLPFTVEQFLRVFEEYNRAIWPLQVFFYLLALGAIISVFYNYLNKSRIIFAILGFFWLWMGIVYHLVYFSSINKAAILFGAAFILQGILFLYTGFYRKNTGFRFFKNVNGITGLLLLLFALLIYPLAGYLLGHIYPASPTFGLPCPTTIFTFGILFWAEKKPPVFLVIIPLLWSVIGFAAAFKLGIREDTGLPIAGLLFIFIVVLGRRKKHIAAA